MIEHRFDAGRSDSIASIVYVSGELTVNFRNGSAYRYTGIDADVVREFTRAESPGTYFALVIAGRPAQKVGGAKKAAKKKPKQVEPIRAGSMEW
jgi:hypothetical protein